jgi:hypothetical protein
MVYEDYQNRLAELNEPWKNFRLDEDFVGYFKSGAGKGHTTIRQIIYEHRKDAPSITFGTLPPTIFSPIFWEVAAGKNRKDIIPITKTETKISKEMYASYKKMYNFQQNIIKVFIINPKASETSLLKSFIKSDFDHERQISHLDRRIYALESLKDEVSKDKWSKLLLCVPKEKVLDKDLSFTITPYMHVTVNRREGFDDFHDGKFEYYKDKNYFNDRIWLKRWSLAKDYVSSRTGFPEFLYKPEDIPMVDKEELKRFNIKSIDLLITSVEGIKKSLKSTKEKVTNEDAATRVRMYLAQSKTHLAIESFKDAAVIFNDKNVINELTLIESRHTELQQLSRNNTITRDEYNLERNKINLAILQLLDEI